MRMGFPTGMGILWESHGNGHKTPTGEWELPIQAATALRAMPA